MGHERIVNLTEGVHRFGLSLKKKPAQLAPAEAVLEGSPVGESRSNSEFESAVEKNEGLIWCIKSHLEHKLKMEINKRHPITAWLPTNVTIVISKHRPGLDGRTAEKRRSGKNWRRSTFQFGELIHVHVTKP